MSNLRGGCLNVTQSCLSGLPVRRAEAVPNNQLANEVGSDRVIRLAGKTTLRQVLVALHPQCDFGDE